MQKENKWLGRLSKGILALWIIALIVVALYVLVPSLAGALTGGKVPTAASASSPMQAQQITNGFAQLIQLVQSVLASLLFLVLVPLSLISLAGMALSIIEIANAGNSGGWKALWIIITLVFGGIGVLAYWYFGRKSFQ